MAAAVVRNLVDALDLHAHDPTARLKRRTIRAYLAGAFVDLKHESVAFEALAAALLKTGFTALPPVHFGPLESQQVVLRVILHGYALEWNRIAACLRDFPAGPQRPEHSALPYLRLVSVDVIVRVAAAKCLGWELAPTESKLPIWAVENSFALVLREHLDFARTCFGPLERKTRGTAGTLTRDDLARRVGVTERSVDNWLDGAARPRELHLKCLAQVLAVAGTGWTVASLHAALRRHAAFGSAASAVAAVIGWNEVRDMGLMHARGVRALMILFETWQQPPEQRAELLTGLVLKGVKLDVELGELLTGALSKLDPSPVWRWALRAATGPWEMWLQQSADAVALTSAKQLRIAQAESGEAKRTVSAYAEYELALAGVKDAGPDAERLVAEAEARQPDGPADRALRLLTMAQHFYLKGNKPVALGTAAAAVMADPENASIREEYGSMLLQFGEADRGVEELRKAWISGRSEGACVALVSGLAAARRFADCEAVVADALKVFPSPSPGLLMWCGLARMRAGNNAGAFKLLSSAVRLAPRNGHAHDKLAECALALDKKQLSERHARKAHRLGVDNAYGVWATAKFGHLLPESAQQVGLPKP